MKLKFLILYVLFGTTCRAMDQRHTHLQAAHHTVTIEPTHEVAYCAPGTHQPVIFQLTHNQEMVVTMGLDYLGNYSLPVRQRRVLAPIFNSLPAYIRNTLPTKFTQNFSWQAWLDERPFLLSFVAITALSFTANTTLGIYLGELIRR